MKHSPLMVAALGILTLQSSQAVGLISLVDLGLGAQSLNRFDSSAPGTIIGAPVPISGLTGGETLLGIDYRPLTGQLFGTSSNRLYTIDTVTGAATAVGSGFATVLGAGSYGFDFNPVIDRIRIVGTNDTNTVGNPIDGSGTVVTPVFYGTGDINEGANPNLVHHAYTNSVNPTPATTQLFALDSALDILVTQANSAGTLGTVGPLGIDFDEAGGFDIDGIRGTAYAALSVGGVSNLYTIDLTSGAASLVGNLNGNVTGFAVIPEPSSALLLGLGALGLLRRKRS